MRFPRLPLLLLAVHAAIPEALVAQTAPPLRDRRIDSLVVSISPARLERDLSTLVGFRTRHTLSDTLSNTRGIGAARRWVKAEFERISLACGGCLTVVFQPRLVPGDEQSRIPHEALVVNVLAILRGTDHPDRYILMTGHLDSRNSNPQDGTNDAPGANDDGSGVVAVIEAARLLSRFRFSKTIVLAALSGEEQGLFGGQQLAQMARDSGWIIEGVLNNDIIGNRQGMNGVANVREFRVFSEPVPATETEQARAARRSRGGEVDGISRQLARYVDRITERYVPATDAVMIYRLDRFGRGGDHRPFNDLGFPAVRITEMNEDYTRQHQDVRLENGVRYGDMIDGVSFPYLAKVARANVATLASLAWAPPPPDSVAIRGAVSLSTSLHWKAVDFPTLAGYRIYWRETTAPQWTHMRYVGNVSEYTLTNVNIDNFVFGVAAVGRDGNESVVVFGR